MVLRKQEGLYHMGDHVLFLAVSLCSFDGVEGGRERKWLILTVIPEG